MVPVGRGQRELVVGDRQTGKTSIGLDTILSQRGAGVFCFCAAVGQKAHSALAASLALASHGAFGYASASMASASASAVSQFLTGYSATAAGEFFMWAQRCACFVFHDDLCKHAVAYRELSLLLRRPPGREAFPGEIFFVHSRLLERSCKLHFGLGGGSITAVPVIETLAGDVSGYIVSNVISITDGQIFLCTDLFLSSLRPAVDVGLSVTRVGSAAQTASMRQVGGAYKIELAQYFELEAFSQFASELGGDSQRLLARGYRLVALLHQFPANPLSSSQQVRALSLAQQAFFLAASSGQLKALSVLVLTLPEWLSAVVSAKSICLSLALHIWR
jgi:F-type H+-transporting ATPase subunit alpha